MESSQSSCNEDNLLFATILSDAELLVEENENSDPYLATQQPTEVKEGDGLLIEQVLAYPILYNKSLKDYKNAVMRENCWIAIAAVMNMSTVDCMKRWGQLRESFAREKKKREQESKSGSGQSKRKGFPFYQDMRFLEAHIQKRKSFTNVSYTPEISTHQRIPFRSLDPAENTRMFQSLQSLLQGTAVQRPSLNIPPLTASSLNSILRSSTNIGKETLPSSAPTVMIPPNAQALPLYTPPASPASPASPATPVPIPPRRTLMPISPSPPAPIPSDTLLLSPRTSTSSPIPMSPSSQYSISEQSPLSSVPAIPTSPSIPEASLFPSLSQDPNPDNSNASWSSIPPSTNCRPGVKRQSSFSWRNDHIIENNSSPCKLAKPSTCYNKETSRPKKVDPIDSSFMSLSAAIQNHLTKPAHKEIAETHVDSTDSDQLFGSLIAAELRKLDEPLKSEKKASLLRILYEKNND